MLLQKYRLQKKNARDRGIEFLLTYNDWLQIWIQSGKLEHRGRHKGNYVMCRKKDSGPYAVGNVFIATTSENIKYSHDSRREKIKAKDDMIASLKQKLWIKNLHSKDWEEQEKKRKEKLSRKDHFKNRFNKILYNGDNPKAVKGNNNGKFSSYKKGE